LNLNKHQIKSKGFTISVIVTMLGLLLPFNLSSIAVILMLVVWLFKDSFKEKYNNLKRNRKFLTLSSFYLIYVLGLFYSTDIARGFSILEKNLTLLILPLVFASIKSFNFHKEYKLISIFAFTNLLLGLLLMVFASVQFFKTGDDSFYYYDRLTEIIDFHPVYLAMYVLFSIVIIIYGYIHKLIKIRSVLFFLIIAFATFLLVLLSSKMILVISIFILSYFMYSEIKNRKTKIISIVIFLSLFAVTLFTFSVTKNRLQKAIDSEWSLISKDYYAYNDAFTGVTLRIITWKLALKHLWNDGNVIIGTAPADSQAFVDKVYAKYGMDAAGYTGYNLHNQYIEIFIKSGFLGLLFFLIWIVIFFKEAMNNKKVYLFFLIIFFAIALTESNLEVHRGIVFFALFNSLFFFSEPNKI